ncbi:MAG TPA: VPLPA-CTERM sorting domain-containing protein [Pseudomonadales bacterium]|nr:VPLPA-CTERM sorting domain-containing protein [Pseudomonadales bacterium]
MIKANPGLGSILIEKCVRDVAFFASLNKTTITYQDNRGGFMKKVLGLAVAMAMASQVNAAISLPETDVANTGGSELILVVWDQANKTTYTRDLGIGYRAFNDSNAYSFAADSRMSSLFGSTLNPSLVWGVWAADTVDSGLFDAGINDYAPNRVDTWGQGFISTTNKTVASFSKPINTNQVNDAAFGLTNFINATNTMPTNNTHLTQANGSSTAVEGQNADSANAGYNLKTNWANSLPASSLNAVGTNAYFMLAQSLYIYELVYDENEDGIFDPATDIMDYTSDPARKAALTQFKGTWKLDDQGTLTWASTAGPAPVPVPAAVWLFISGLAGLAGIARRQTA